MKVRIEMEIPNEMDAGDVLARAQELAVELAYDYVPDDDEDELDEDGIADTVSVEIVQ